MIFLDIMRSRYHLGFLFNNQRGQVSKWRVVRELWYDIVLWDPNIIQMKVSFFWILTLPLWMSHGQFSSFNPSPCKLWSSVPCPYSILLSNLISYPKVLFRELLALLKGVKWSEVSIRFCLTSWYKNFSHQFHYNFVFLLCTFTCINIPSSPIQKSYPPHSPDGIISKRKRKEILLLIPAWKEKKNLSCPWHIK